MFDKYWPMTWAKALDAAERGIDGLTIQHETPPQPADMAFLCEGRADDGRLKGRAVLRQQNW